jgi:hypothetical protein
MLFYPVILIKSGQNPGNHVEKTASATTASDVQNHPDQLHQSAV